MPFGDGTGPWWADDWECRGVKRGPMRMRLRRGFCAWRTPPKDLTKEEKVAILKKEATHLENRLKEVKKMLKELG